MKKNWISKFFIIISEVNGSTYRKWEGDETPPDGL